MPARKTATKAGEPVLTATVRVERGCAGVQAEVPIKDAMAVLDEMLECMAELAKKWPDMLTSAPEVVPGGTTATYVPDDEDGGRARRRLGFR